MEHSNRPVRYVWVDTLRFLAMFAVYLGHLMDKGGKLYPFVYAYHVPLFFLLSGFFASSSFKRTFTDNLKRKFFTIMIPYFGFSLLNLLVFLLVENGDSKLFVEMVKQYLWAVRGQAVFGWALWFLPCLFVISVMFDLLYRVFKRLRISLLIILGLSFILHAEIAQAYPVVERFVGNWFFSIDSAFYYLVFYAIGAVIFPWIKDKKYSDFSGQAKFELLVFSGVAVFAAGYIYFNESGFAILALPLEPRSYLDVFVTLMKAMTIIYVNFILAHSLSRIELLPKMGRNTLVYCGTEDIVKTTVSSVFLMGRLSLNLSTPFITFMYTMIIMVLSYFTVIPFVNKYLPLLSGKYQWKAAGKTTAGDRPSSITA